jgi:hypothetical protein
MGKRIGVSAFRRIGVLEVRLRADMAIMTSGFDEVDDPFQTPTRRPVDTFPHCHHSRVDRQSYFQYAHTPIRRYVSPMS